MLPRLSCGIRIDYLLLEHVVFSDDLDFCLWEMLGQGALNRFLVVLIWIETRAVLIMKVSLALIFSCAGFSTFAYFFSSSHGISLRNVKSWGGGS